MEIAIIDTHGTVISVVAIDNLADYDPGPGLTAIDATGKTAYAGCTWSKSGGFVEPPVDAVDLDAIKSALKQQIDADAETERQKYITSGSGQALTYQQKFSEAQSLQTATDPQPADYPLLAAEIGITAPTLAEVADVVLAAYRQWQQVGAAIEAIRLGSKRDVDAAEDETTARAVLAAIVWPSAQVQG